MEQGDSINFFRPLIKWLDRPINYLKYHKYRIQTDDKDLITTDWGYGDNPELFEENIKKYPKLLTSYIEKPIKYTVNNDGCRAFENFKPDISREVDIYLGCSFTFGVGHHWENTWPYFLGKFQGRDVLNLGIPGGSIETSFIMLSKFINYYTVRNVFHYQPIYPRYAFPVEYEHSNGGSIKGVESLMMNCVDDPTYMETYGEFIPYNKVGMFNLTDQEYIHYNHYIFVNAIKGLCGSLFSSKLGFPKYYHLNGLPFKDKECLITEEFTIDKEISFDWGNNLAARDIGHYTLNQNIAISEKFQALIKEYPEGYTPFENLGPEQKRYKGYNIYK